MKKTLFFIAVLGFSAASAASFVTSNAASKTATITVDANQGTVNGGLNFNGAAKGAKSFTIPAGWNVVMQFKNMGAIPHSAIVVKGGTPPMSVTEKDAAFPGASTRMVMQGMGMNAADTVKFKASKAGSYLIICGVPGHALGGQYLGLKVVAGAKAASYK
jgi:uncharacterized cupredoxin-like copper-binding protein